MVRQSPWYGKRELEKFYLLLEIGDLLEFGRKNYFHWAVYVGPKEIDGVVHMHCVIHRCVPPDGEHQKLFLASQKSISSISSMNRGRNLGSIAVDTIESVLEDDIVRINNELDSKWTPFDGCEIVIRAEDQLNRSPQEPYHLIKNNCEHFANKCRYGRNYSRQIHSSRKEVVSSVAGITLTTVLRMGAPMVASAIAPPLSTAIIAGATVASTALSVIPPLVHALKASSRKRRNNHSRR